MKFKTIIAAIFLFATQFAFAGADHLHWSYEGKTGPNHWAELDASFMTCKVGKTQSPINIETKEVQDTDIKPISFGYSPGNASVINNGHTIQVNLPQGGTVNIGGTQYSLLQFHFHTPSEEQVNGKSYPLVAHLVHKDANGKLAVVAVLFKEGAENQALKQVFANLPANKGDTIDLNGGFNTASILPADQSYYAFIGSLTTPPCSEEVRWQVLKNPVEISKAQLASFQKLYQMNARPVQPMHGRKVQM